MLATLPPEMQEAIFKHMDDEQALLNVMLASHHFFQMAEPILYTHICLRSTSFRRATSASRSDRLRSLLNALLVSDGKRANYVRALAFPLIQIIDELALVGKVITTTVNLKALRLRIHILSYQFHTRLVPSQFTLTCLHVECPMLIPEMQHFLESQTSLETLHLQLATVPTLAVSRTVFSSTSFPTLKTLIANLNLIPAFLLTSACVQNLRVIARDDDIRVEDTVRMTSVRLFSCRPEYARRSRASQLPNLEWLEVAGPTSISAVRRCWSHENHKLRGIIIWRLTSHPPHDFRALFDAIPTLEFVEYIDRRGMPPERWYRAATCPSLVRWLCSPDDQWLADWERDVVITPQF
ncbi:hypothetical protein EYR40_003126 [Pleurotus pulmonarius]|nr:hypothetical protein EYR40_003126 [Pleurotus pulmonarius]